MVSSAAATVEQYLASLPADRRAAIARVRDVVNARLPPGFEETMQYGMISWIVPRSRLAATYNGQPLAIASLASQKQYMALYLMSVYGDAELGAWFRAAYRSAGKKLDMGKSCVRFKTVDALPLDVVGEAISRVPVETYLAVYETSRSQLVKPRRIAKRAAVRATRPLAKRAAVRATRPLAKRAASQPTRPAAKRAAVRATRPAAKRAASRSTRLAAKRAASQPTRPAAKRAASRPTRPAAKRAGARVAAASRRRG